MVFVSASGIRTGAGSAFWRLLSGLYHRWAWAVPYVVLAVSNSHACDGAIDRCSCFVGLGGGCPGDYWRNGHRADIVCLGLDRMVLPTDSDRRVMGHGQRRMVFLI